MIEQVQSTADQAKAAKLAEKITKGRGFDFTDLREQLAEFNRMGGIQALASKLPNQALPPGALAQVDDGAIRRQLGIIDSMTPGERRRPAIIAASRKRRIAAGAGVQVQEVNRLLKQFMQMEKVMKKMRGGGLAKLMRSLGAVPGRSRAALTMNRSGCGAHVFADAFFVAAEPETLANQRSMGTTGGRRARRLDALFRSEPMLVVGLSKGPAVLPRVQNRTQSLPVLGDGTGRLRSVFQAGQCDRR